MRFFKHFCIFFRRIRYSRPMMISRPALPAALTSVLRSHPHWRECRAVRVAFSGGVDSLCLLHALCAVREELGRTVSALHVNHGLAAGADALAGRCVAQCAAWGVECRVLKVRVKPRAGESLQSCARRERYAALAAQLAGGDVLLTAHHRDDQAETVLFHLLRGAGARGLRAIPGSRRLGAGYVCRPLLGFGREDLLAHAKAHGLQWDEDAANRNLRFDRNYLRHRVMPLIIQRWPHAAQSLARSAKHLAEVDALLATLARDDLARCRAEQPPGIPAPGGWLTVTSLTRLPPPRMRNALRAWLGAHGLPALSAARLDRLCESLAAPTRSRAMRFDIKAAAVRRYRDLLMVDLQPDARLCEEKKVTMGEGGGAEFPELGYKIVRRQSTGRGIAQSAFAGAECSVRPRAGGERCRIAGAVHRRALKKILAERGIPPWQRSRLPLVFIGERLAAIPGLFVCHWCAAGGAAAGVELTLAALQSPP